MPRAPPYGASGGRLPGQPILVFRHLTRPRPPEGAELVSWMVAMSHGFIITLRVEPGALPSVNRFMEQKAWGAFRYEVFPSYDFGPIAAKLKQDHA